MQKLIDTGNVRSGEKILKSNYRIKNGETLVVTLPEPVCTDVKAQAIPIVVVYEDSHVLVVEKPRGMVVHPAAGNPDRTLVNALLEHCKGRLSGIGGVIRPGIVHRIDKDTSGLLVVAKTDQAHGILSEAIKRHDIKRKYIALVDGIIKENNGIIDAPIGRHRTDRKKMAVDTVDGKNAVTHFRVLERFPYTNTTYVELTLETGRTHQIRVHMSFIGHPVAGDPFYSGKKNRFPVTGQVLHAFCIGFVHPLSGEYMEYNSKAPDYFENMLKWAKNKIDQD